MKLYLNKRLESIPIVSQVIDMVNQFYESDLLKGQPHLIEQLQDIRHYYDPVWEFLNLYNATQHLDLDHVRLQYVTNALYNAKGAPKVLEILQETLEWNIEYDYQFPQLLSVTIDELTSTDVNSLQVKFKNMLYYLLYFTQLTLYIKNLTIPLEVNAVQSIQTDSLQYQVHVITSDNITII